MRTRKLKTVLGFTLVEIMIVVLIIGILMAIAIPTFLSARENSRAKSCVANLWQINSAKLQYCIDNKMASTATCAMTDLVGPNAYIKNNPTCPLNGTYTLNNFNTSPTCSVGQTGAGDYASGGRFYHGLPQ